MCIRLSMMLQQQPHNMTIYNNIRVYIRYTLYVCIYILYKLAFLSLLFINIPGVFEITEQMFMYTSYISTSINCIFNHNNNKNNNKKREKKIESSIFQAHNINSYSLKIQRYDGVKEQKFHMKYQNVCARPVQNVIIITFRRSFDGIWASIHKYFFSSPLLIFIQI